MTLGTYNLLKDNRDPIIQAGIGDSLKLYLDSADKSTITESSNLVSQHDDKSPGKNNVTQPTGAEQPLTNTTTVNDRNVIDYDGGDNLIIPSALFSIPTGDNTIIAVAKRASEDASIDTIIGMATGARNDYFIIYAAGAGTISFKNRTGASGLISSTGNTNTNLNIIVCRRQGAAQGISVNGETEIINTSAQNAPSIDDAFIGQSGAGTLNLIGNIATIAIYNRLVDLTSIDSIVKDLAIKWGISLP